jgi:caffeoyl-CoA O-methyltransferase
MRQDVRTHAHDLNGVLGTILASADLNAKRSGTGEPAKEAFASIAHQARRASDLVERLVASATAQTSGDESPHERDLDYLESLAGAPDAVTLDLENDGRGDDIPIVDRETGRLLAVLVSAKQPHEILEIGTAYGYSTLWMAKALGPGARVVTIDPDRTRTARAESYFARGGVRDRIEIRNAPALEVLPTLPASGFDMVFIDALKEEYGEYLRRSIPLLRHGGLVVVDNLLWAHRASLPKKDGDDASLVAIRRFNEELFRHPQLLATILPVGDGVGVAVKV